MCSTTCPRHLLFLEVGHRAALYGDARYTNLPVFRAEPPPPPLSLSSPPRSLRSSTSLPLSHPPRLCLRGIVDLTCYGSAHTDIPPRTKQPHFTNHPSKSSCTVNSVQSTTPVVSTRRPNPGDIFIMNYEDVAPQKEEKQTSTRRSVNN